MMKSEFRGTIALCYLPTLEIEMIEKNNRKSIINDRFPSKRRNKNICVRYRIVYPYDSQSGLYRLPRVDDNLQEVPCE